jgi:hypothetical protein
MVHQKGRSGNRTREWSHPPCRYKEPLFFNGLAYVNDLCDVNDVCSQSIIWGGWAGIKLLHLREQIYSLSEFP